MTFRNKVALITGGGTGIGKHTALLMSSLGAKVAITGRRKDKLLEVKKIIINNGEECLDIVSDVSKVNETHNIIHKTVNRFGKLDILINNAGIYRSIKITDMTEKVYDNIMNINMKGTYFLTKYAIHELKNSQCPRIVNISSVSGLKGIRKLSNTAYSASKAAMIMFTKSLALELSEYKITVNCICPAVVETELFETLGIPKEDIPLRMKKWEDFQPLGRNGKPEEIARAIAYLSSDDASWITGSVFTIDGGVMAE